MDKDKWSKWGVLGKDWYRHGSAPGLPNPPFSCSPWEGSRDTCGDSVSLWLAVTGVPEGASGAWRLQGMMSPHLD